MNNINAIKSRFRNLDGMRWIRLSELRQSQRIACVDGRHTDCVIGAPGGNIGEFILTAAVIEEITGETISSHDVEGLMQRFVSFFGAFYSHTDEHALRSLQTELQLEGDSIAETLESLRRGPGTDTAGVERWQRAIVKQENTGCGHLSLMLANPKEYGLRQKLVEDTILAFFKLWWEGSEHAEFVVLHGEHQEQAVVTLEVEGDLDDDTLVPTVCSLPQLPSVFIHHRSARFYLLREMMEFMANALNLKVDQARAMKTLTSLADRQLHATAHHLMMGLEDVHVMIRPPTSSAS